MSTYPPKLADYIAACVPPRTAVFARLEQEAATEKIPIISPEVGQYLSFLVALRRPRKILEIGAAIGYSALWLMQSFTGERLDTIELSGDNLARLRQTIAVAAQTRIRVLAGDALLILPQLTEQYDFIFVDAQKAQYAQYLQLALPLLSPGGLIVFDNVLWHGQVAGTEPLQPRYQKAAEPLRQFMQTFLNHSLLTTALVPIGDGLAVGVKHV